MSRVQAYEGMKFFTFYPVQTVAHLIEYSAERRIAVTEAIREHLTAARTLGGAPLVTHERLAYLAHQKRIPLEAVVADALERATQRLPEAPPSTKTNIREYTPEEVQALLKDANVNKHSIRGSGVRFQPTLPLQEIAHLERYATRHRCGLPEAGRERLEFWRTLGGISIEAHRRIAQFAASKGISLESAVANLLTEYARELEDPPPSLQLDNGLQVLPAEGLLERLGKQLLDEKKRAAKRKPGKKASG
ncbi:MAG: hypothetical protein SFW67_36945 [Myxococcaceae bacterium]|nr:hypothetical protein [Myxococcaceae bacterium]